ncbi:MAG: DUF192 domain-containing protein [Fimbriimonadaceae bacterium]
MNRFVVGMIASLVVVGPSTAIPLSALGAVAALAVAQSGSEPRTGAARVSDNPNRLYQLRELEVVTLKFRDRSIKAWVMDTIPKRMEGMMFLRDADVPDDHGMIFVFPEPEPLSFWMRNTLIDLDIAYIDERGRTLNVARMKALDETGVPSAGRAKYALEMKAGAFRRLGIQAGTVFQIPSTVRARN